MNPIGLPFAPDSPKPLAPDHPLYHQIALDPVADMPSKVGSFLVPITSAKEMNEALRDTLERANMLAPPGAQAKARLVVRWAGLNAPAKISFSSEATARLSYSLIKIENGQELFRRDIATVSRSTGGDASDRLKGNARLAILTNLASRRAVPRQGGLRASSRRLRADPASQLPCPAPGNGDLRSSLSRPERRVGRIGQILAALGVILASIDTGMTDFRAWHGS